MVFGASTFLLQNRANRKFPPQVGSVPNSHQSGIPDLSHGPLEPNKVGRQGEGQGQGHGGCAHPGLWSETLQRRKGYLTGGASLPQLRVTDTGILQGLGHDPPPPQATQDKRLRSSGRRCGPFSEGPEATTMCPQWVPTTQTQNQRSSPMWQPRS